VTVVPLTSKLAVAPAASETSALPPTRSAGDVSVALVRPSEVAVKVDSCTVMVSVASEPTMTVTPDANELVPSRRLCPL
jgi:hypothetical protein